MPAGAASEPGPRAWRTGSANEDAATDLAFTCSLEPEPVHARGGGCTVAVAAVPAHPLAAGGEFGAVDQSSDETPIGGIDAQPGAGRLRKLELDGRRGVEGIG